MLVRMGDTQENTFSVTRRRKCSLVSLTDMLLKIRSFFVLVDDSLLPLNRFHTLLKPPPPELEVFFSSLLLSCDDARGLNDPKKFPNTPTTPPTLLDFLVNIFLFREIGGCVEEKKNRNLTPRGSIFLVSRSYTFPVSRWIFSSWRRNSEMGYL